eukprot:s2061_g10.t1
MFYIAFSSSALWQLLVDRTTLIQHCADACVSKKGNMDALRQKLINNFLRNASAQEILDESSDRIVPLSQCSSEKLPAESASSSSKPTSQSKDSMCASTIPKEDAKSLGSKVEKLKKSSTATSLEASTGEPDAQLEIKLQKEADTMPRPVTAKYKHLRVNRKSCVVIIDTFQKPFRVSASRDLWGCAQIADTFRLRLEKKLKKELVDKCAALGLKKTGAMAVLKYRIIDHFSREIEEALNLETEHNEPAEPPEPPLPPPPGPPGPPEEAPADASQGEKGQSDEQSAPFVFGRKSFAIAEGGQDNTAFFTDAKEGHALKETARESQSELLQAGTDGVIPVATLVKVLDGFKGIEDGEKQVAFLLAGWGRERPAG